jgi:cation/acetate symporter
MKRMCCVPILALCLGLLISVAVPAPSFAGPDTAIANAVVAQAPTAAPEWRMKANKPLTLGMFILIIGITLYIVYWAAQRTKTTADFYAARSSITAWQNGWAIAGDYMSAATFLGMAGLICFNGLDGFLYPTGWMVAFVTVLLVMAEPCRNSGKYTVGDVLCVRSNPKPVRACAAIATVCVSAFYLTAQMVGAGKLMNLLVGIPYALSIVLVGILIIIYVVFGGMIATTWVQIIKAALLVGGGVIISILVLAKMGFNPIRLFNEVAASQPIQEWVRVVKLKQAVAQPGFDYGQRFLEPGLFLTNVWDQVSLGMATCLGTAGMPHILMRFFTVPDAKAARKSVVVSMFLIATFFILTTVMGYGAALLLTPQEISKIDPSGNMANPLLARYLGNWFHPLFGDLFQAFVCAVAFATILAVVSGLVLASSAAVSHDIYTNIIKDGKADQKQQVTAARIAAFCVGLVGLLIALGAENQNVAHLVALAFAVSAAGVLPTVVLSLFWKKMATAGICAGLLVGTFSGIGLVLISPNMQYPKLIAAGDQMIVQTLEKKQADGATLTDADQTNLAKAKASYEKNKDGTSLIGLDKPLFTLKVPAIVCIPAGLIAAILFALLFPSKREEDAFDELYVRQVTGIGASGAVSH